MLDRYGNQIPDTGTVNPDGSYTTGQGQTIPAGTSPWGTDSGTVNTGGDWWTQNSPSARTATGGFGSLGNISNTPTGFNDSQVTQMMQGQTPTQTTQGGGGNVDALIQQFYDTHPVGTNISELANWLKQNGVQNVQVATHGVGAVNGIGGDQISGDKLIINGRILDSKFNEGGADQKWQLNWEDGGGQGGSFGSLAQGFNQPFNAPSAEDAMNSPGIQAALKMGQQAIERSAASKGTLLTGGTLKDLSSFANDLGIQGYQDVWNRARTQNLDAQNAFYRAGDTLFNRNFSLAELGANTAVNQGTQAQNYANASGDLYTQQGNANAAGTIGASNAWMPTFSMLGNGAVDALTPKTRSSYLGG